MKVIPDRSDDMSKHGIRCCILNRAAESIIVNTI